MKIAPEFFAIGIWCLFVAAIAVGQDRGRSPSPATAQNQVAQTLLAQTMDSVAGANDVPRHGLMTGRSAAKAGNGPYGNLFIDPSLQDGAPVAAGPKPTSADLTAP